MEREEDIKRAVEFAVEDFEIASIITFLCCENARFITGAAIPVDGGYTSV